MRPTTGIARSITTLTMNIMASTRSAPNDFPFATKTIIRKARSLALSLVHCQYDLGVKSTLQ